MFGYIDADRPELRVKDDHLYRSYYCGLCRAMATYGKNGRLLLNYDCAFLYLLLSGLAETPLQAEKRRCIAHPLKKRWQIIDAPAEYAAAVNILLGAANLQDKRQDGQKFGAGAALFAVRRARKKAEKRYPALARAIGRHLRDLAEQEASGQADIDRAAHPFAQLLGSIFCEQETRPEQKRVLQELGYQLGRWIYLADAWQDRKEDLKGDQYNVFNQKFGKQDSPEAKDSAEFNLKSAVNSAILAYDLLEIKRHKALLENIMYRGIPRRTEAVLRGEKVDRRYGSV